MIPHSRPALGPEEKQAIQEVLDSGYIAQGKKVAEFEKRFCEFTKRRFAVAVSSGSAALHLSLVALEVGKGDEVILPSFTCTALLHAVEAVGAKPVLVDIDLEDFNISVRETKKKIRRKTKAILVPHSFGRAARMEELLAFKIPIIEDGTQALGASVGNEKVGSFGTLSIFSFYATKMITTGEGGMVLTHFPRLAEKVFDLRDYDKKETHQYRTNSKMTDIEAVMGIEQLKKLPVFIERRRRIATGYGEIFSGTDVTLPQENEEREHVYFRYVVRFPKKSKERFRELEAQGLEVKKPVYKPLHHYLGLSDSLFPNTQQAMRESCSLPIFPSLSEDEWSTIAQATLKSLREQGKVREKKPVQI